MNDSLKRKLTVATDHACILDDLPFVFPEQDGMMHFVIAVFETEEGFPANASVDLERLTSSANAVKDSVLQIAAEDCKLFSK